MKVKSSRRKERREDASWEEKEEESSVLFWQEEEEIILLNLKQLLGWIKLTGKLRSQSKHSIIILVLSSKQSLVFKE